MKGQTGSTLSRTKYVKCFSVETSCYVPLLLACENIRFSSLFVARRNGCFRRLHCYWLILRLNFLVTVELLNDQAGGDFVQCQTEMRAFAVRICSEFKQIELNWNRIVHQNALWSLVFSTTRQQTNLRAGCKSLQPGTMTCRRSETFQELLYLFSSEYKYKGFYLYQREDWRIDWNQL